MLRPSTLKGVEGARNGHPGINMVPIQQGGDVEKWQPYRAMDTMKRARPEWAMATIDNPFPIGNRLVDERPAANPTIEDARASDLVVEGAETAETRKLSVWADCPHWAVNNCCCRGGERGGLGAGVGYGRGTGWGEGGSGAPARCSIGPWPGPARTFDVFGAASAASLPTSPCHEVPEVSAATGSSERMSGAA